MSKVVCRKCGKGPNEIDGFLARMNEKGVDGIWECRPSCGAKLTNDEKVLQAIRYQGPTTVGVTMAKDKK